MTTLFCSPASPKSNSNNDPAYSAGTLAPGTRCGAWMWPESDVLRAGRYRFGRSRVRLSHVQLTLAARGTVSVHLGPANQEMGDQERDGIGSGQSRSMGRIGLGDPAAGDLRTSCSAPPAAPTR